MLDKIHHIQSYSENKDMKCSCGGDLYCFANGGVERTVDFGMSGKEIIAIKKRYSGHICDCDSCKDITLLFTKIGEIKVVKKLM